MYLHMFIQTKIVLGEPERLKVDLQAWNWAVGENEQNCWPNEIKSARI